MGARAFLVTGGCGFIGSALVRRLVTEGHRVRVLDDQSRGTARRLADVQGDVEMVDADIRDADAVSRAIRGVDVVCHLAFVNGTEYFYTKPDLVLDVGVKGMVNVIDACLKHDVGELILASSAEVYQTPPVVPTDETVPLTVPDPLNPRYSYGAGKIISEIMAINYGRTRFERVAIFRPHNVYGPDMGSEHVVPQFIMRMAELIEQHPDADPIHFPVQGSGRETRAFVYIDDLIDGVMCVVERGEHLEIYHVGTMEEVSIADLASLIGERLGRRIEIVPGAPAAGGTARRCPDISKVRALGYQPRHTLREGLARTAAWYVREAGGLVAGAASRGTRGSA